MFHLVILMYLNQILCKDSLWNIISKENSLTEIYNEIYSINVIILLQIKFHIDDFIIFDNLLYHNRIHLDY